MLIFQLFIYFLLYIGYECSPCKKRTSGADKFVCVCDESYCDKLDLLHHVGPHQAAIYETNCAGARFKASIANFSSTIKSDVPVLTINCKETFQLILGFGGAFTDAAGINIKLLSPKLQKTLLSSYFADYGLQYNMGRIPIASCDFSTYPYSYADVDGDFNLTHFKLQKEDFLYKIPFMQLAKAISKEQILFFGTPWSPPAWMKTNNAMNGRGYIKGDPGDKYHKAYANYLVRFLQAYHDNNITLWGMTTQNEPTDGCVEGFPFQALCFPPEKQRDFLKKDLIPALKKAGFTADKFRLMIGDDMRVTLPKFPDVMMADPQVAEFIAGIAFHWYFAELNPHRILDVTHKKHPNLFLLATEACNGAYPWESPKVDLGNCDRAESYANDILLDLLNWSIGWIDWNLAVNLQGGPNWVKNYVDAPIIVNGDANEFLKQPMYYVLAQFSKFLTRGSYRIGFDVPASLSSILSSSAIGVFETPENKIVVITVNRKDIPVPLVIHDPVKGFLNATINPRSVQTFVW